MNPVTTNNIFKNRVCSGESAHLVDWHIFSRRDGHRFHFWVHGAVLRQSISQIHQVVIQSFLQLQHFNLMYTWVVQLVADLHT